MNNNDELNLDFQKFKNNSFFRSKFTMKKAMKMFEKAKAKGNKIENGKNVNLLLLVIKFGMIFIQINNQFDKMRDKTF